MGDKKELTAIIAVIVHVMSRDMRFLLSIGSALPRACKYSIGESTKKINNAISFIRRGGNDGSTQKGDEQMSEKEKKDIQEMVENAKILAERDPQAFMIAKSNMDILKARSDLEKAQSEKEGQPV